MDYTTQNNQTQTKSVAIIGGGLVGSLAACFLGQRGYEVHLFEYRDDIRTNEHVKGRSINLAMSNRARRALARVGLEKQLVEDHGIPMAARMIHEVNGNTRQIPYDARTNQCIYSVGRKHLNEVLITAAENYPNVHFYFNHKLIDLSFERGHVTILDIKNKKNIEKTFDLIIGADGAFSAVRRQMMKQPLFDFSQTYIEHGYLELCIPPTKEGQFAMPRSYLHIWPRGEFMMIALPNQDYSWTVTLFMPFVKFQELKNKEILLQFFQKYFPDSIPLIGKEKLIHDFFKAEPSPLVSVKCSPYHYSNKVLIIGDAAHAMVPFYGQGMNAGFEDCYLLDQLLNTYDENFAKTLEKFSEIRKRDAHSICDLAMYNYVEMRDLVTRPSYRIRKKLDDFLFWILPNTWVPLYNSVTFSNMKYEQCIQNRTWQDKILTRTLYCIGAVGIAAIFATARYSMFSYLNTFASIYNDVMSYINPSYI